MNKSYLLLALISYFLFSCSNSPKELPLWKIKKENQPISYLVGVTEYLTEEEVNKRVSEEILKAFDTSQTLITYWNLAESNLLQTKEWIELGDEKSIKDSLPSIYELLQKETDGLPPTKDSIETAKIKPHFFLFDKLNYKDQTYFNIDQFWIKNAMPKLMNLKGLETFQNHYKSLPTKQQTLVSFVEKEKPLNEYYANLFNQNRAVWKENSFDSVSHIDDPVQLFFASNEEKQAFMKSKYEQWSNSLDSLLKEESCFVSLDIKYLFGKNNLIDYLLSKGYQIEKVN